MRGWAYAAVSICLLSAACGGQLLEPYPGGDDSIAPDYDASEPDAQAVDAGPPLGDYTDIADQSQWSSFDVAGLNPEANGFYGATFDGRYMYMAPYSNGDTGMTHGHAVRFDTRGSFTSSDSWTTFDTTTLSASTKGFAGAAFDGRYVYFAPHGGDINVDNAYDAFQATSVLVRFDTQGSFTDAAAWSTFDLTTLDEQAQGYCGATFDGRYLYLVPFGPDGDQPPTGDLTESIAVRFDTQSDFSDAGSYATMDLTPLPNEPSRRCSGVFDGRYLYLSESQNGADISGAITRYDTTTPFTSTSSWSTFNVATVDDHAQGFAGSAFDGHAFYVMSSWYGDTVTNRFYDGVTARFDTTKPFGDATSWQTFDASQLFGTGNADLYDASFFHMGGFDGRFVYFIPAQSVQNDAVIARYDTLQPYESLSAWSFSPHYSQLGAFEQGGAAVFDGQSLYFVPLLEGKVLRFNARTTAAMPKLPQFTGSFF